MQTLKIEDKLKNILEKEQINPENALREFVILSILGKKEKYLLEISKFEKKYNSDFYSFAKLIHSKRNQENFEIEDDLMDWEFAIKSLEILESNLAKLKK